MGRWTKWEGLVVMLKSPKDFARRGKIPSVNAATWQRSNQGLYTEFHSDVKWIQERVRVDCRKLPSAVKEVAHYYLSKRVKVLRERDFVSPHPLSPRPIPYLAFWFARGFGVDDVHVRRLLGLSLVYACLSASPSDDLLDGSAFAMPQQMYLARWFWERYFLTLRNLFSPGSPVWYIVSKSTADWNSGESHTLFQDLDEKTDPLSAGFLRKTSRYLVALMFPTLAGVALLSNRPEEVKVVRRFTNYYCMGWRILDDLRDCSEDSLRADIDNSCVLSFLRNSAGIPRKAPLTQELIVSLFSDQTVIGRIYSAMTGFYLAAKHEAESLKATYVVRFIDQQLLGHEAEWLRMAAESQQFREALAQLVESEYRV
jgi:hypothetical protein